MRVPSYYNHTGFVAYTQIGEQVMLHNSKKLGRAAMTTPKEFSSGLPVVVDRLPQNMEEAVRIVQYAWEDVQRGAMELVRQLPRFCESRSQR